jgi:dTDP-4-dehydrorhamnose 3,5-epimerase
MRFLETPISGAWVLEPERRLDERGYFARGFCQREFAAHGLNTKIAQGNTGFSRRAGTLRGIHYQVAPHLESKLVRCTGGAVYDVVVDLRPESPTFGGWFAVELSAENGKQLYIPEGCGHGYQTLTDNAEIYYQASEFYAPESARGVRYDDPAFGIRWPLEVTSISEADRSWPSLAVGDFMRESQAQPSS